MYRYPRVRYPGLDVRGIDIGGVDARGRGMGDKCQRDIEIFGGYMIRGIDFWERGLMSEG